MLGSHKSEKQPNTKFEHLYEFFKNLNLNPMNDENVDELNMENPTLNNYHINGPITRNGIRKCVSNLKNDNDKACGDDNIINEYIKNSLDIFRHL